MSDCDNTDLELEIFLSRVKPNVKHFFEYIVKKEGREKGIYTFQQALAELVFYLGVEEVTKLISVDQVSALPDFNRWTN